MYWKGQGTIPIDEGARLTEAIVRLLAPVIELPNPLSIQVKEEEREIIRLTEEQFRVLNLLSRQRRAVFHGCAGSGKTMLAVEKAKRLTLEGFRTMLCCYNAPLARHLREVTAGLTNLTVCTFFQMCETLLAAAGRNEVLLQAVDLFAKTEMYPDELLRAVQEHPEMRFDAIIVDEGQDFAATWWVALEECLNENNILYVFYDENQCLHPEGFDVPNKWAPYLLEDNVRNTRYIHNMMLPFFRDASISVPRGPQGREVERHEYKHSAEMFRVLSRVLHRLLRQEGLGHQDVVVLTPRPVEKSALYRRHLDCGAVLVEEAHGNGNAIILASIESFKGLERPVVIVVELDGISPLSLDMAGLYYVALSRARSHLILLGTYKALEYISSYNVQEQAAVAPIRESFLPLEDKKYTPVFKDVDGMDYD